MSTISSAYAIIDTLMLSISAPRLSDKQRSNSSSMNKLNKYPDRIPPCLTPKVIVKI